MASRRYFYLRAEEREGKLLRRLAKADKTPFDGVLINATHIAPFPAGKERRGGDHEQLLRAAEEAGLPWTIDAASAPRAHPLAAERTSARARLCPLTKASSLPWNPEILRTKTGAAELIDRADHMQRKATGFSVPYLEVSESETATADANLTMIKMATELSGDRRTVAYLQTLRSQMRSCFAAEAARRYIAAGAETVMIRIRHLDPTSLEDLLPYFELIETIEAAGARAVPDCVGAFGPATLAAGADAFTAGSRFYNSGIPKTLLEAEAEDRDGGPRTPYLVPGALLAVDAKAAGRQDECRHQGCESDGGLAKAAKLRPHNLHELYAMAKIGASAGHSFAVTLRQLPGAGPQAWATALETRADQRGSGSGRAI